MNGKTMILKPRLATILLLAFTMAACSSAPVGDAQRGADLFAKGANGAPQCGACHQTTKARGVSFGAGPSLAEIAERAGERIEGMSAEQYLRQSIEDPAAYLVNGFGAIMYADYAKAYTKQQIDDLVAYLLTL
jgi:mono/diheme cytochrome c family protein